VFDFGRFQEIFEPSGMNFAKKSGSEGTPVNRSFKTGEVDDKSLESEMHTFEELLFVPLLIVFRATHDSKHFSQHLRRSCIRLGFRYFLSFIHNSCQELM
jgi:hypothetical protein